MLAKRIIPCLDVTGGRVVKGVNFVELRDAGDPVEIAARYDREGQNSEGGREESSKHDDVACSNACACRPRGLNR